MVIDLIAEFEKYDNEFLRFEAEENPLHPCPDICAFLLLHRLVPLGKNEDMVFHAEQAEIFLATNPNDLAKVATSENIRTLVRCGVRYSDDSLAMFV